MKKTCRTIGLLCLMLGIVLSTAVSAKAGEVIRMRLATHQGSGTAEGNAFTWLGKRIEEKSGGRIKAEVFLDGSLGPERALQEMIRDNTLEICHGGTTGPGRFVPALGVLELPYLFRDNAQLAVGLRAAVPYVDELLAPYGYKPMGFVDTGFRFMLTKTRPITKVADLKGLKMRAPNPVFAGMFRAFGANVAQIDWMEVYSALQSGVVDGMEAGPNQLYAMKFFEQAKYLAKTYHVAGFMFYIVNKKWFDGLPKDLQPIVRDSIEEASDYGQKLLLAETSNVIAKMAAAGIKVNEVDDLNQFKDAVKEFKEDFVKQKGSEGIKLYSIISGAAK